MTAAITDFGQFAALRNGADRNDPAALREVAGQFEALFLQTMLKNMRAASLGDPLFGGSESHEMYQEMLDQQLSLEMAGGRGIGLAEMLVRQMGGASAAGDRPAGERPLPGTQIVPVVPRIRSGAMAGESAGASGETGPQWNNAASFARDLWPHVERAAARLNVAPEAILAQAALETGWGKHVPGGQTGSSSFNLFGIKAGSSWSGERVSRNTLEFRDGIAQRETAQFRAYGSVGDSVDDYSRLLTENPRYAEVSNHGSDVAGFANALQRSGYATDPEYARKLSTVAGSETMTRILTELKNAPQRPIRD